MREGEWRGAPASGEGEKATPSATYCGIPSPTTGLVGLGVAGLPLILWLCWLEGGLAAGLPPQGASSGPPGDSRAQGTGPGEQGCVRHPLEPRSRA